MKNEVAEAITGVKHDPFYDNFMPDVDQDEPSLKAMRGYETCVQKELRRRLGDCYKPVRRKPYNG